MGSEGTSPAPGALGAPRVTQRAGPSSTRVTNTRISLMYKKSRTSGHRWHLWASRKCSAAPACSFPCHAEAEEPPSPGQGWIQCGVPSPAWAGTAGASLRCHRPPQRGLTEESVWEGPTGSSFEPLSVEDDLFVLGVGDLPSCLEPPDGLPHVLGLQGGQLPPLLTHIQRFLHHLPNKHLGDARHGDDNVLGHGGAGDGLDELGQGQMGTVRASQPFPAPRGCWGQSLSCPWATALESIGISCPGTTG